MSSASEHAREPEFGQGPPPAGGWKKHMTEDPTEYSPAYQDEYRRLWHRDAARAKELREALADIAAWVRDGGHPDAPDDGERLAIAVYERAIAALAVPSSEGETP